jgi:predicted DsbA family dithiol-disulfide isomerase
VPREIAVTFDYRCPFARIGHDTVVHAIQEGALPDVTWRFVPFSLDQVHADEGSAPVWEREPDAWGTGVLSLLYGIAVRDVFPEQFLDAHVAIFDARHEQGLQLEDETVLRTAVESAGLDADAVAEEVWGGQPLKTLATEHTEAVDRWGVFGVPTYIEGEEAVFVRTMERRNLADLERVVDMLGWTNLNEFKRTRIAF